jgi:hypothetical protein
VDLKDVNVDALTLYRLEVDQSSNQLNRINQLTQNLNKDNALDVDKQLSEIWSEAPLGKSYYIVVQAPKGEFIYCGGLVIIPDVANTPEHTVHTRLDPQPPPFLLTPTKDDSQLDYEIHRFLETCRPMMRTLLEKSNDLSSLLPSWELDSSANKQLATHISNLRIPTVSNQPSLLLHDLGEVNNEARNVYLSQIFSGAHACVV